MPGSEPVDYAEMHGYPQEDFINKSATRKLICNWNERDELIEDIIGTLYPYQSWPNCYPRNISAEPIPAKQDSEADTTLSKYEKAIITVEYESPISGSPEAEDIDGVLMTENFQPTLELMTLPYQDYYWKLTVGYEPIQEQGAPVLRLPGGDLITTRYGLAAYPAGTLANVGKVNTATYSCKTSIMSGISFAAGTLLWQPSTTEIIISGDTRTVNYTTRFTYRPTGWNKFWNGKKWVAATPDSAWEVIYRRDLAGAYVEAKIFEETAFG